MHWAGDRDEANQIVLELLQARGAKALVKGKSMVSEEMGLNHFLEAHGIEALESDLGEYIIQLDGETPSHIIMPAIHKNKDQIARHVQREDQERQVHRGGGRADRHGPGGAARRSSFDADAGLSGVNFAVAETGTLCLVENEGNGRMSTHVPPLHIAAHGPGEGGGAPGGGGPALFAAHPLRHRPGHQHLPQPDLGAPRPGRAGRSAGGPPGDPGQRPLAHLPGSRSCGPPWPASAAAPA